MSDKHASLRIDKTGKVFKKNNRNQYKSLFAWLCVASRILNFDGSCTDSFDGTVKPIQQLLINNPLRD